MKPIILYAIVDKKKPKLSYNALILPSDKKLVKIYKNEKLVKVKVQITK